MINKKAAFSDAAFFMICLKWANDYFAYLLDVMISLIASLLFNNLTPDGEI